ncbi:hypothetical protein [Enhygromyxa salina]|uniref:Uncharacterized protein n=1 Tax=Enhygromyxa salina TaxID=215803 RepID=A0A2S9XQU8_9BACT|nr:hypothetical protein [Enhygromyxa salina]PRP95110.1 hypothetical protein ENSA7_74240 [Enhygromyxa salina]
MIELDEATRHALLARDGPPPGTSEQILATLRVRLGPGSGGPGPGGPEPLAGDGAVASALEGVAEAGRAAWVAKVIGATVGLTGAGLLVLKVGAMTINAAGVRDDAPPTQDVQVQVETADAGSVGDDAATEQPAPNLTEPPEPSSTSAADSSGLPRAERSSSAVSRDDDERDDARSDLAAEVALLRDAKQLRATAPQAALEQLERHRAQFPAGTLAPERDALRIELLCALGRVTQAEAAREQFAGTHPGSPLQARIETTCAGTDPERGGD